jgi:hypothetical protein
MLLEEKEIAELFYMKHRNDSQYKTNKDSLLGKTISPHAYKNETMSSFLRRLQNMMYLIFDQITVVRNFKNPTVDKYEFRHPD